MAAAAAAPVPRAGMAPGWHGTMPGAMPCHAWLDHAMAQVPIPRQAAGVPIPHRRLTLGTACSGMGTPAVALQDILGLGGFDELFASDSAAKAGHGHHVIMFVCIVMYYL